MMKCMMAFAPVRRLLPLLGTLVLLAGCGGMRGENAVQETPADAHTADSHAVHEHGEQHQGEHVHGEDHRAGHGHGEHHHGTAETGLAEDAELRIEHDERSGRILLTVGPFELGSGAQEPVMLIPRLLAGALPVNAWVVGLDVEILDAAGTRLPQSLMHHSGLMLPGRRDLFRPILHRLAGAGEETEPVRLPWPFGVPVSQGEEVMVTAMLHNDTPTDYGSVYLRFALETAGTRFLEVRPFFIDVSPPPGRASWDLPPGRSTRSWEGTPAVDGRILGLGGHLHRYGVELLLEDATTGKVLHRLQPELEPDGSIRGLPQRYFLPFGVRVHRDRVYRITAVYDNPTGTTIPAGAMGSFGGVLMPRGGSWPASDPSDPLFQEDLDWYRAAEESAAAYSATRTRQATRP